jgi:hypothetical protein
MRVCACHRSHTYESMRMPSLTHIWEYAHAIAHTHMRVCACHCSHTYESMRMPSLTHISTQRMARAQHHAHQSCIIRMYAWSVFMIIYSACHNLDIRHHTHAYAHTCIRTHMHTHTHAYAHTCIRTHMHTHTHAYAHTCIRTHAYEQRKPGYTITYTNTQKFGCLQTDTRIHSYSTCRLERSAMRTCIRDYTYSFILIHTYVHSHGAPSHIHTYIRTYIRIYIHTYSAFLGCTSRLRASLPS